MEELLQQVVSLHGVQVGYVVDVIVDAARKKPIGLEVRCEDGRHRFLPMAAASSSGGEIVIDSPFALLDGDELDFYRQHHATLRNRREPAA